MTIYNQTEFYLTGFSTNSVLRMAMSTALILVYIVSLSGNLLTILITSLDQHLQTPMYFFLRSLATSDILFISTTVPKLLSILLSGSNIITLHGCLLQLYMYLSVGCTIFYTLGLLSIDRYIAIFHPLQYLTIMNSQVCWRFAFGQWILGFVAFTPLLLLISRLHWCNRNVIDHFFCDGSTLLHLSCSDTHVVEEIYFGFTTLTIIISFIPTLSSYCFIISAVCHISSSTGKSKMFSTCSSHLIVVGMGYGSCIFIYICSSETTPSFALKTVAVFNSILCPALHPLLYSLRNQATMTSIRSICRKLTLAVNK
ncbi:hypothetical protein GDO78_015870 [Eleutherodactylus coqui]|uniref:G-protein coupled receptors family 1 profile domain-containing protein n=1 Tax=Eleutherodactylus coqui TaxID=57060 RepID=A0A8J6B230_ELECQ|nr:hypothetical protein GDO78_015870 [Eleutherodactylus coqui]